MTSYKEPRKPASWQDRVYVANNNRSKHYNRRHRETRYEPGDKVWVWTPVRRRGLSEKLLSRYFGPYEVVRRLSDLTYEVKSAGHERSRQLNPTERIHVVRMKPYYDR